jgi:hypothetical protein
MKMKKTKTKTPKKLASIRATLWAVKKPKAKSPPSFMPDEVAVILEGDKGLSGYLGVSGWSITPSPGSTWTKSRLETNYDRLCRDWAEEISKGWILEIRAPS